MGTDSVVEAVSDEGYPYRFYRLIRIEEVKHGTARIGIVIGAMLGVAIMSLSVISKECEKWEEEINDKRK